jgi:mono/diheme cytochrome c family protein
MRSLSTLAIPIAVLAGACGESDEGGGLDSVDPSVCASGKQWTGGTEGSPSMLPGTDCIGCHASGEGPSFTLAGTVYSDPHAKDSCGGVAAAEVEITDANGQVLTLSTNPAGSFYTHQSVTMPIHARVLRAGKVRAMTQAVDVGSCNTCHTTNGASDAPGRILAP